MTFLREVLPGNADMEFAAARAPLVVDYAYREVADLGLPEKCFAAFDFCDKALVDEPVQRFDVRVGNGRKTQLLGIEVARAQLVRDGCVR